MTILARPIASLQRLSGDNRGATAILFALSFMVLCASAGMAVDYSRSERVRERIERAADSANLAAAKAAAEIASKEPALDEATVSERAQEIGNRFFLANLGAEVDFGVSSYELTVRLDAGAWVATSEFSADSPATLLMIAGIEKVEVTGQSSAAIKPGFAVLDIAMCIDSTGSMTPTLDAVKANATTFYDNLSAELQARGIAPFSQIRVRLAFFKDFGDATPGVWDPDPLRTSDFYTLPDQNGDFLAFAAPQMAGGGWDWAEGDIVCLNDAIDSDWMKVGDIIPGTTSHVTDVYPLIVVWTDSPAHGIDFANSLANPAYPPASAMPRDYGSFLDKWNDPGVIDQANKQILYFGDPTLDDTYAVDRSAWLTIKDWPGFSVGGTLLEGNASMLQFLADGIARSAKELAITN